MEIMDATVSHALELRKGFSALLNVERQGDRALQEIG
jgi:hypothetical protein